MTASTVPHALRTPRTASLRSEGPVVQVAAREGSTFTGPKRARPREGGGGEGWATRVRVAVLIRSCSLRGGTAGRCRQSPRERGGTLSRDLARREHNLLWAHRTIEQNGPGRKREVVGCVAGHGDGDACSRAASGDSSPGDRRGGTARRRVCPRRGRGRGGKRVRRIGVGRGGASRGDGLTRPTAFAVRRERRRRRHPGGAWRGAGRRRRTLREGHH
jgi:hypothetical protein